MSAALVLWLDILRRAWGKPITVNSGWRCLPHNTEVGGARTSRHMTGCAADIRTRCSGQDEWRRFRALTERLCRQPGWEFILYPAFIHIAVPRAESERTWGGEQIKI